MSYCVTLDAAHTSRYAKKHGVKMVVAASSAAVYGDIPHKLPIDESNTYGGKSPYAKTKWDMELLMQRYLYHMYMCTLNMIECIVPMHRYNTESNVKSIALRFFNVYGPRQAAVRVIGTGQRALKDQKSYTQDYKEMYTPMMEPCMIHSTHLDCTCRACV